MGAGEPRRLLDLLAARLGPRQPDVLQDAAVEEVRPLRHERHVLAPLCGRENGDRGSVGEDSPLRRIGEAHQQVDQRALSGPTPPDDGGERPGLQGQVDLPKRRELAPRVGEPHAGELDPRSAGDPGGQTHITAGRDGSVQDLEYPLRSGLALHGAVPVRAEIPQGPVELRRQEQHHQGLLERHTSRDQAHPEHDRDERDGHRRHELQHEPREKRELEHPHRALPELLAHRCDPLPLRRLPTEDL